MQLLFEQYFTDALDFSRDLYKKLRNSTEIYPTGEDVIYKLSDDPLIDVIFARTPNLGMQTALGGFYRATKGKRSTVTLKNGKKARRMLVLGGEIVINVANIIQKYRHLFSIYKEIAPAIIKIKKNSYAFSDDVSALHFATIVKELIDTNFFAHVFAHEVQHFYNPWVHKRAESHRKVKTDLPLTQDEQRDLNYLRSNAEVDSRTIEAAVRVIGAQGMQHVFDENTPENQKKFVIACIQDFINTEVWDVYPEWLRNKLIRRWSKIYQHEMQRRSRAGKR
jgi:hypothetical protein